MRLCIQSRRVKNIYDDVSTREVSEEEVEEFKIEIGHEETTDLEAIGNCSNENYCMKYHDFWLSSYGRVIYRQIYLKSNMNENFIISRNLKNYFYLEYLYLMGSIVSTEICENLYGWSNRYFQMVLDVSFQNMYHLHILVAHYPGIF